MARLVTLSTLQSRVQQRTNMQTASNAVLYTTAELTDMLNEGIADYWTILDSIQNQDYYRESVTFSTAGNVALYAIGLGKAIPVADFMKVISIDVAYGQNIILSARPYMESERNRYKWFPGWVYNQPIFYRRTGKSSVSGSSDSISFIPTPSGAYQVTLNYVPTPTYLVNAGDTFDGVCGFEEIVVLSAAIKLLHKQGKFTDAAALQSERERLRDDARSFLGAGDQGAPERVQDVSVSYDIFGRPSY